MRRWNRLEYGPLGIIILPGAGPRRNAAAVLTARIYGQTGFRYTRTMSGLGAPPDDPQACGKASARLWWRAGPYRAAGAAKDAAIGGGKPVMVSSGRSLSFQFDGLAHARHGPYRASPRREVDATIRLRLS